MSDPLDKVDSDRCLLTDAQEAGWGSTLLAYTRLSGPGWLQSAITLGGGSLSGALFLGILGGTSMLWLQLVAIIMGVVMLSAISYVTLSTGERPFRAINRHINPVLGWGWLVATCMANMIWCMPQFSLCYAALQRNLIGAESFLKLETRLAPIVTSLNNALGLKMTPEIGAKFFVSAIVLVAAGSVVYLSSRRGVAAKLFDLFLKALIGMIVICFFGVVIRLTLSDALDWGAILNGFIPDLSQWNQPTGKVLSLVQASPEQFQAYWSQLIVTQQRDVMIGAAATAVGINMTFLLPYSMLARGWDKPFRGLARFDLATGMAIPYVLVTSCVVIASASSFHATADEAFLSQNPETMATSPTYGPAEASMLGRVELEVGKERFESLNDEEKAKLVAELPDSEKRIASSLVKRDAFQLSLSLSPLLGEKTANLVFGLGIFGMGFSTIIILMLINGYAVTEMFGRPTGGKVHVVGCLIAGLCGAAWPLVWKGDSQLWLAIITSTFGMMLLPIAYVTFFMMMNSSSLMGKEKPTGLSMLIWNVLMAISVLGAVVAAGSAIYTKFQDERARIVVIPMAVIYIVLVIIGFFLKPKSRPETDKEKDLKSA